MQNGAERGCRVRGCIGQWPVGIGAGEEGGSPNQFRLHRLEEGFDHRVIVAIALARHRDPDPVTAQRDLVIRGVILATAIGVMERPSGWTSLHIILLQRRRIGCGITVDGVEQVWTLQVRAANGLALRFREPRVADTLNQGYCRVYQGVFRRCNAVKSACLVSHRNIPNSAKRSRFFCESHNARSTVR